MGGVISDVIQLWGKRREEGQDFQVILGYRVSSKPGLAKKQKQINK